MPSKRKRTEPHASTVAPPPPQIPHPNALAVPPAGPGFTPEQQQFLQQAIQQAVEQALRQFTAAAVAPPLPEAVPVPVQHIPNHDLVQYEHPPQPQIPADDGTLPTAEDPRLAIGARHADFESINETLVYKSIQEGWTLGKAKNSSPQSRVWVCRSQDQCPFRILASWSHQEHCIVVRRITLEHTCEGSSNSKRHPCSRISFLLREIPRLMEVNKRTPSSDIIAAVKATFGYTVPIRQAQRVKKMLITPQMQAEPVPQITSSVEEPKTPGEEADSLEQPDSLDEQIHTPT